MGRYLSVFVGTILLQAFIVIWVSVGYGLGHWIGSIVSMIIFAILVTLNEWWMVRKYAQSR